MDTFKARAGSAEMKARPLANWSMPMAIAKATSIMNTLVNSIKSYGCVMKREESFKRGGNVARRKIMRRKMK